jgi:hypothetical protein
MRWFSRLYGSNPLHLLVTIACFAIAGYAANKLAAGGDVKGILIWLVGAVVGHDLILFPLYALADRSIMMVFRRRPPALPAVPWINYLRVPAVFSAILLLIWFPLIFRLPTQFQADHTTLPTSVYMGRWLAVTGALFLLSAIALAFSMGTGRRGLRSRRRSGWRVAGPPSDETYPEQPWDAPGRRPEQPWDAPGRPERPWGPPGRPEPPRGAPPGRPEPPWGPPGRPEQPWPAGRPGPPQGAPGRRPEPPRGAPGQYPEWPGRG